MSQVRDEKVKTRWKSRYVLISGTTLTQLIPYGYERIAYYISSITKSLYICEDPAMLGDQGFLIPVNTIFHASLAQGNDVRMPVYVKTSDAAEGGVTVREDYQEVETGAR